uniref:Putative sperm-associated antigen 5 isoform x2 n=1 Tax=Ixodes ricinus TaxID=34613 RepID=A0A147BBN3_IXORI
MGDPAPRGTLVRSKSLRLPPPGAEPQEGGSPLRRHGSLRLVRAPPPPGMSTSLHSMLPRKAPGHRPRGAAPTTEQPWKEHFKRLVQEHDRLQVKYSQLRARLLSQGGKGSLGAPTSGGGPGDLAPIPEDDSPDGELPPAALHARDDLQLQGQLRSAQRAYWDLVLGAEPSQDPAALVLSLLDQLDSTQAELSSLRGRVDSLREALRQREQEVASCRDALHDYQLEMEEQRASQQAIRARMCDLQAQLREAQEGQEFLQAERATLVEAQLEAQAQAQRLREALDQNLREALCCERPAARTPAKSLGQPEEGPQAALSTLSQSLHSLQQALALFGTSHLHMEPQMLEDLEEVPKQSAPREEVPKEDPVPDDCPPPLPSKGSLVRAVLSPQQPGPPVGEARGEGKPVGTVPPFRTVEARAPDRLLPALAALAARLVRLQARVQARALDQLASGRAHRESLEQRLGSVCRDHAGCGHLGQQLSMSQAQVQALEARLLELREAHARQVEMLLQQLEEQKEKQRCLQAVNQEQARQLREELLPPQGFLCQADAICDRLQLRQQVESLREGLVLREEQLRGLASKFSRFKQAYEDNYQRATEDIDKLDTMLERVIETLETEPEAVSSCPALQRLLESLRGSSNCWGCPPRPPPGRRPDSEP